MIEKKAMNTIEISFKVVWILLGVLQVVVYKSSEKMSPNNTRPSPGFQEYLSLAY